MKIVNNKLYGDTKGSRENAISDDETAKYYTYITSFDQKCRMLPIEFDFIAKYLVFYNELLFILCRKTDDKIINTMFIPRYDINKITNNYEFGNGSYKLDKLYENVEYSIAIFIENYNKIYVTCDDNSKGYLFGKEKYIVHI